MHPSCIIYKMEKESRAEKIKEDLIEENFGKLSKESREGLRREIVIKHNFKAKENYVNWIVQIPGKYLGHLLDRGRIYLQWRTYRVKEYVSITRCFKCQGYWHIAKECKNEVQLCENCGDKNHLKKD